MADEFKRQWPAWLFSVAALGVASLPDSGPWVLILIAWATGYWAWLAYVGRRHAHTGVNAGAHESAGIPSQALRNLIVESSRTAGNDLRALRTDLTQVRGLVRDAAVTLGDGFQGIDGRIQLEVDVIKALMAHMLGATAEVNGMAGQTHGSPRVLLQEVQNILQSHIDNLTDISHCRGEAIHRMDELVNKVEGVVHLLKEDERDESGRTGDATYAAEIPPDGISDRLRDQLDSVSEDVTELRRMIGEVIVRDLTAAISTKRVIDAMLAESAELNSYLSDVLTQASSASAGVNESIRILVRSLQCEDVVCQLLEYCDRQVAGIEAYIDDLVSLLANPKLDQRPEEQQEKLMRACESYLESSTRWASDRQRHITQTSMQAGNVELF